MRNILFRGKTINQEGWVYGSPICEALCVLIKPQNTDVDDAPIVATPSVGEFSGRVDKNGEPIFEGDIVRGLFYFQMSVLGVCTFRNGAFGLTWKRGNVEDFTPFTSMCNVEYEVIGNTFDNPDLLETWVPD